MKDVGSSPSEMPFVSQCSFRETPVMPIFVVLEDAYVAGSGMRKHLLVEEEPERLYFDFGPSINTSENTCAEN